MKESHFSNPTLRWSIITKVVVWGTLFLILYLLRSFFLLIFLTFVFSYLQYQGVGALLPYIKKRALAVTTVGLLFLGVLLAIGGLVVPSMVHQARLFADNYGQYIAALDAELDHLAVVYPVLDRVVPSAAEDNLENSPTKMLLQEVLGISGFGPEHSPDNIRHSVELLKDIGKPLLAYGSAFLLSLIFSFLIVLDLPRLTQKVQSLAHTKLAFVYEEVAEGIAGFARELGQALHAQAMIAVVNTLLTAGAILLLGIDDRLVFLSVVVFLCGLVPVAGVFMSSVPICLMSLERMGIHGLLLAAALIWAIHMVEAYVLNPRIFGSRLQINPVLVLIILTIAGKLFGVWGLILSLPICRFLFGYAIQYREPVETEESVAVEV